MSGESTEMNLPQQADIAEEVSRFLDSQQNLAFIFFWQEKHGEYAEGMVGHGVVRALELAMCLKHGDDYSRTDVVVGAGIRLPLSESQRHQAVSAVTAKVQTLRQQDEIEFVLGWAVDGEREAHLDFSYSLPAGEAFNRMVEVLKKDLEILLS